MKLIRPIILAIPFVLLASCNPAPTTPPVTTNPVVPATDGKSTIKIGYVLHVLNDFSAVIKRGAEDAGKALGVDVEVIGPASGESTEAIGMFEGMIQKKKDGLIVVPMPGEVWVKPIQEAATANIPVLTANMTSTGSAAVTWFGQDEYESGVTLAREIQKLLDADGKKGGSILVGNCKPGVAVLDERYKGFLKGLEGSKYKATEAKDVGVENTANYSAWESLATANPDMIAAVGLCSMDIPNLSKLKTRSKAKWLVGGYDLNAETLEALKSGSAQITLGQNPYLQGYLPVLALVRQLKDKKALPKGWVDVGTEIVTKDNVEGITPRETDRSAETHWYADHIAKNFADFDRLVKPVPKTH